MMLDAVASVVQLNKRADRHVPVFTTKNAIAETAHITVYASTSAVRVQQQPPNSIEYAVAASGGH
jgi:hypothetical protein